MAKLGKEPLKFPAVEKGAEVALVAPSAPTEFERSRRGMGALASYGYQMFIPVDLSENYGSTEHLFSSDSVARRLEAIEDAFESPSTAAILTVRGGYGAMELLPALKFKRLTNNPKPFIGLSDATVLLTALYQKAGLVTVHGPSLESSFCKLESAEGAQLEEIRSSIDRLIKLISGKQVKPLEVTHLSTVRESTARLTGGNLSVIAALMGTPWEVDFDDHIVFLEDTGEKPYRIHRMLTQLVLAGKFKKAKGVVLGNFDSAAVKPGQSAVQLGPTLDDVFKNVFSDANFPVVSAPFFGHRCLNLALPLGILAQINKKKLDIIESAVLQ